MSFQGSNIGRFTEIRTSFSALDSLGYVNLLTHNGDWLSTNEFLFSVHRDLGDTLHIQESDSVMSINGNIIAISISKNGPSNTFFNQLTAEDIAQLRTIQFKISIGDTIKPYLKRIGRLNPAVDMVFFPEVDSVNLLNRDLRWLSQYFKPRALFFQNETDSVSLSSLTHFPSLETLFISLPVKGTVAFPQLPHLKEIMLYNEEDRISVDADFFNQMPDLTSLTIINESDANFDWSSLNTLKKLQSLYIESDSIILKDVYVHHPHLSALHLGFNEVEGASISDIFKKNKLKRLSVYSMDDSLKGLYSEVLPDAFPELESLEFKNNDSLLDYSHLKHLKKLKYLTVFGKAGNDTTLYKLNQLRYLSLSEEFLKDSINRIKLQKALPNTVIAPNSGACMGSGWLLFIVPVAFFWFYFFKSKKHRNHDCEI
ncbi:hypothetical protein [Aestuariibaculum suncheonense]|uniref:Uncharacterized protein n=1 Tax=Aestuariibaculum suncheonense TaxID=1028745 RepID=A0A8J6QPT8_9FLAO|nr:hypothetical protein [Aestuariibaculum suncheonense]MBD0834414.1 hypothetical protein [Aestuariibaculum suncheonense]